MLGNEREYETDITAENNVKININFFLLNNIERSSLSSISLFILSVAIKIFNV